MKRSKQLISLMFFTAAVLSGCGGSSSTDSAGTAPGPKVNTAPVANAGKAQSVYTGSLVTLDATSSTDVDGDTLKYTWKLTSRPAKSNAYLSSLTDARPTFTADETGNYVFTLIVNDGKVDSAPATVTVAATVKNIIPVADAGKAQSVVTGKLVTLDGSQSYDGNGDAITYKWSLSTVPAGSKASLSSASSMNPTFTPDIDGNYVATLIVNDGQADSAAATVTVTSATVNSPPVALTGTGQTVAPGTQVTLDGSGSYDPNGDPLTYKWTLSIPEFSKASLSANNVARPVLKTDVVGPYIATLVVNDGKVDSQPASVSIFAKTANNPPVAKITPIGNGLWEAGREAVVDGTASYDIDGDRLSFNWTLVTVPAGSKATFTGLTTVPRTTFSVDVPGTYTARLIVNDGTVNSAPVEITVTALTVAK